MLVECTYGVEGLVGLLAREVMHDSAEPLQKMRA